LEIVLKCSFSDRLCNVPPPVGIDVTFDNRPRRHDFYDSSVTCSCEPGYPNERRQLLPLSTRDSRFSRRHVMNRNCPRDPGWGAQKKKKMFMCWTLSDQ